MAQSEIITALDALMESIRVINSNLIRLTEASEKLYDRIFVLEQDLQERSLKKKFFKSLFAFYPLILILLLWIVDYDHTNLKNLIKDVSTVTLNKNG